MASRREAASAGSRELVLRSEQQPPRAPAASKARAREDKSAPDRKKTRSAAGHSNGAPKRSNGKAVTVTRLMRVRELDPQTTCGRGTTVMQLFRVDDSTEGALTTHLVFLDRHGWYCEHGRDCPAVAAVRKHDRATSQSR